MKKQIEIEKELEKVIKEKMSQLGKASWAARKKRMLEEIKSKK